MKKIGRGNNEECDHEANPWWEFKEIKRIILEIKTLKNPGTKIKANALIITKQLGEKPPFKKIGCENNEECGHEANPWWEFKEIKRIIHEIKTLKNPGTKIKANALIRTKQLGEKPPFKKIGCGNNEECGH